MDNQKIGEFLKALRKAKGKTQEEVAIEFNVSNKTVSKWENGVTIPDIGTMVPLAEYYGVTVDEILKGERENTGKTNSPEREEQIKNEHRKYLFRQAAKIPGILASISYGLDFVAIFLFLILYPICMNLLAGIITASCLAAAGLILAIISLYFGTQKIEFLETDEDKEKFKVHEFRLVYWAFALSLSVIISGFSCFVSRHGIVIRGGYETNLMKWILCCFLICMVLSYFLYLIIIAYVYRKPVKWVSKVTHFLNRYRILDWFLIFSYLPSFYCSTLQLVSPMEIAGDNHAFYVQGSSYLYTYTFAEESKFNYAGLILGLAFIGLFVFTLFRKRFPRFVLSLFPLAIINTGVFFLKDPMTFSDGTVAASVIYDRWEVTNIFSLLAVCVCAINLLYYLFWMIAKYRGILKEE